MQQGNILACAALLFMYLFIVLPQSVDYIGSKLQAILVQI